PAKAENKLEKTATVPQPSPAPRSEKLSYKEKFALETLPARMARLEEQISQQQKLLADPGLFMNDPAAFQAATDELEKAQTELNAAEEQWLELEVKREALEG
ncbi:MAG: ABC transporter ATP-binding protein, partial [Pseudomonadota bacterium]